MVRGGTARGLKLVERVVRVNVSGLFENRSLWALDDDARASALSQASNQKELETVEVIAFSPHEEVHRILGGHGKEPRARFSEIVQRGPGIRFRRILRQDGHALFRVFEFASWRWRLAADSCASLPDHRHRWNGGEGGIRTPGTLSGTPVFKTGAINHSATSPGSRGCCSR
jgi:hypothetical protein